MAAAQFQQLWTQFVESIEHLSHGGKQLPQFLRLMLHGNSKQLTGRRVELEEPVVERQEQGIGKFPQRCESVPNQELLLCREIRAGIPGDNGSGRAVQPDSLDG